MSTIDPPRQRSRRLNLRALIIIVVGIVVLVPGFLGIKMLTDQHGAKAFLREAKTQIAQGKTPLAVSYLNRYLELVPDDLEALELKSKVLFDAAHEPYQAMEALKVHGQMIAAKPNDARWEQARRRMVRLNLMVSRWRSALGVAEKLTGDDAEVHLLKARACAAIGLSEKDDAMIERARKEYETAEARSPGDVESAEELARIYRDRKEDPARALQVLNQVVLNTGNVPKKHSAALLARARHYASALVLEKDPEGVEKATRDVDDAVRDDPSGLMPRLMAAEIALQRHQPEAARQHLKAIGPDRLKDVRDELRVKNLEGMIDLAESRPEEAIRSWREGLLEIGGNDANLTWQLAHVLLEVGRVSEAEPLLNQYRRLVGGDEPDPKYLYLSALALLRSNRPAEAAKIFEKIRSKVPKGLEPHVNFALGQACELMRDQGRAREAYQLAADGSRKWAPPWKALARIQNQSNPEEANATLQRGLTLSPDDADLLAARAQLLYLEQLKKPPEQRVLGEVERLLARAARAAPGSAEVALFQAEFYGSNGRTEDALALLKTACTLSPKVPTLWLARANILNNQKRLGEAQDVLIEATKAAGPQAIFFITRATISARQGHLSDARKVIVAGLESVPKEQKSLLWKSLGEFYQAQKDYVSAAQAFQGWAALQPENPEPRLALFQVAMLKGEDSEIKKYTDELRSVGGDRSYFWRYARVEDLLRVRKGPPDDAADASRFDEAARLVKEIEDNDPQLALGYMLDGRLAERRKRDADAAGAYRKALERGAGQPALTPLVTLLARGKRHDEIEQLRKAYPTLSTGIEQVEVLQAVKDGDKARARELTEKLVEGDPQALDIRKWEIEVLQAMGDPKQAQTKARKWIAEKPSEATPWLLLLMLQINAKDPAAASETIEQIRRNVKTDRPEMLLAQCYRATGDLRKAAASFQDAIQRWPDDFSVLGAAVSFYEQVGLRGEAEETLRQIRRRDTSNTWATRKLALSLAAHPNDRPAWDEALALVGPEVRPNDEPDDQIIRSAVYAQGPEPEHLRKAGEIVRGLLTELPDRLDLHEQYARMLLAAGDVKAAREHAARAATSEAAKPETILLYASILLATDDLTAAEEQLSRLSKVDPNGLPVVELKARLLSAQGKPEEGAKILEKAYERYAPTPDGLVVAGKMVQILTAMKQPEAAERVARRAAQDDPRGLCLLAEYQAGRGRLDDAAEALDKVAKGGNGALAEASALAIAVRPGADRRWAETARRLWDADPKRKDAAPTVPSLERLAMLLHVERNFKDEVATYRKMLDMKPSDYMFVNNMAWSLSEELHQPEEALKVIGTAVEKVGKKPHILDTRGVIYTRLGKYPEAVKDLEAASGSLRDPSVDFHLARAYLKMGKPEEARKTRERALKAGLGRERLQESERADWDAVMNP